MKKLFSIVLAALFLVCATCSVSLAEFDPESVSTPYIVLMDASSGAVLYEKNSDTQTYPASTTKIMTAILAIEHGGLEEYVNVGSNLEKKGSSMNLSRNEEVKLIDLIYGMMLKSGNDAAKAIAEYVSGSEEEFAVLMNSKARELGMLNTNFVKPNGLHNDDHKTTAYDMALLTKYAMQNETFRTVVSSKTHQVEPTNKDSDGYLLENTNKLLYTKAEQTESFEYKYAIGVKTGDTDQAGRCLVAAAQKGSMEFILVMFGDYSDKVSSDYRFINAAGFFDWAFENYSQLDASSLSVESSFDFPVSNASYDDSEAGVLVATALLDGLKISGTKDSIAALQTDSSGITATVALDKKLTAPINEGDVLGTVAYQYNGKTLFTADLVASRSVNEQSSEPTSALPSTSPLLINDTSAGNSSNGNSWLIWVIIAAAIIIILFLIRFFTGRRRRRRTLARRKAYRSPYRKY